jgi:HK97 gp10 family phage protein
MPTNRLVVVTGIKELDRKLKKLAVNVQRKIARQAARAGMKIIAAEARAQVPVVSGLTKSSIKVRATKKKRRGDIGIDVRVTSKTEGLVIRPPKGRPVFYPSTVEYGDRDHPPNPFMRRVFQAKGPEAQKVTMQAIRDGVEREARK